MPSCWGRNKCTRRDLQARASVFQPIELYDRRALPPGYRGHQALDYQADIAKVQEWLGHANTATARIYDHRKPQPEDSPTFEVNY
jgi:site-specific recombinase XerC